MKYQRKSTHRLELSERLLQHHKHKRNVYVLTSSIIFLSISSRGIPYKSFGRGPTYSGRTFLLARNGSGARREHWSAFFFVARCAASVLLMSTALRDSHVRFRSCVLPWVAGADWWCGPVYLRNTYGSPTESSFVLKVKKSKIN